MKFPIGDIIRALNPGGWLGKIFKVTKGVKISWGGHEILLGQKHGTTHQDPAPFNQPHQPGGPPR